MMSRALIITVLIFSVAAHAQQLNYKMHHGDVLVYQEAASTKTAVIGLSGFGLGRTSVPGDQVDTAGIVRYSNNVYPYLVNYSSGDALDLRIQSIDENGIVYQQQYFSAKDMELFPTIMPSSDTMVLINNRRHNGRNSYQIVYDTAYNFRMYDTLVCGAPVRAMSFTRGRNDTLSQLVVSDIFGLVSVEGFDGDWHLTSATIAGVDYAHDTRPFAAFPTCAGSEFIYKTEYWYYSNKKDVVYDHYKLEATWVDGIRYYRPDHLLWDVPEGSPFRVEDGIAYIPNDGSETMLRPTISLGIFTRFGVVTDTGTVSFAGETFRFMETGNGSRRYTWLEGIGLWKVVNSGIWFGSAVTTLEYARICGRTYGTPVSIPETPVRVDLFQEPYPNPVSHTASGLYIRAKYPLFGTFHFTLYDALGKKVYHTAAYAPSYVTIPVADVSSGFYYLHITGNNVIQTFRIFVQ